MNYPTYRLSAQTTSALAEAGMSPLDVESLVLRAVMEDIGGGVDVTTMATVPVDQQGNLEFVARADGVVAGGHRLHDGVHDHPPGGEALLGQQR